MEDVQKQRETSLSLLFKEITHFFSFPRAKTLEDGFDHLLADWKQLNNRNNLPRLCVRVCALKIFFKLGTERDS